MTAAQVDMFAPPIAGSRRAHETPAPIGGAIQPRGYQLDQLAAVEREHESVRSTLVVSATGTGKTITQAEEVRRLLVASPTARALLLSERVTLLHQNAAKIRRYLESHGLDERVTVEQGDYRASPSARVVVACVPSIQSERLKFFLGRHRFDKVIADEAHHHPSASWRAVTEAIAEVNPEVKITGYTATPRPKGMGAVYDSTAAVYGLDDAWRDGYLTRYQQVPCKSSIGLDGVEVSSTGELHLGQLDEEVARHVRDVGDALLDGAPDMRTVVFTPGILTAQAGAAYLNTRKPGCARSIDSKMDRADVDRILEQHAAGEFDYLLQCRMLVEGYDDACLMAVMVSAVLKGGIVFPQMLGRGTRVWATRSGGRERAVIDGLDTAEERLAAIAASPKPRVLLIDPGYNSERHDLASVVDLMSTDLDETERKIVKRILRERGGAPEDAIADAKARAEEERARLAAIATRAAVLKRTVELGRPVPIFAALKIRPPAPGRYIRPEDRPTDRMSWRCRKWGLPVPATKREFRKMMAVNEQRKKAGKCQLPGIQWLARFGVNGWKLTRDQGLRVKAAIADNGFRALTPDQLDAVLAAKPAGEDLY